MIEKGFQELSENEYTLAVLRYDEEEGSAEALYKTQVNGEKLAELGKENYISTAAATASVSDSEGLSEDKLKEEFVDFINESDYELSDYANGLAMSKYLDNGDETLLEEPTGEELRQYLKRAAITSNEAYIFASVKDRPKEEFEESLEIGGKIMQDFEEWKES